MRRLIIKDLSTTVFQDNNLREAFERRHEAEWNLPVEKYGFGCKNIDEILTHIQHDILFDYSPREFEVK